MIVYIRNYGNAPPVSPRIEMAGSSSRYPADRVETDQPSVERVYPITSNRGWMVFYFSMITFFLAWEFKAMIMRLRELIIAFKNKGERLSYGREIKYHWSTAKYPVLDRNMVSGGFAPHMHAAGVSYQEKVV